MNAIPLFIVKSGHTLLEQGTLFLLPIELNTPAQKTFYATISKAGWSICPQGYWTYVFESSEGTRYVLPGLIIKGEKNSKKNFLTKKTEFSKDEIERYAQTILSLSDKLEHQKNSEIALLVHDLRALSSAIYNSAEEARNYAINGDKGLYLERIETVIATHTMLSIRIDMMDVAINQVVSELSDFIPVYKKIDKVTRCFRPKASARNIIIHLRSIGGYSVSTTYGPSIFELIAYSIIDNAVKYSPDNKHISVTVEDAPYDIIIRVQSWGPQIRPEERLKIFRRGYRGRQATRSGQPGTGVGLSTARELIEDYFGGTITAHQEGSPLSINEIDHFLTTFEVIVPREIK